MSTTLPPPPSLAVREGLEADPRPAATVLVAMGDATVNRNDFASEAASIRKALNLRATVIERANIEIAELRREIQLHRPTIVHLAAHVDMGLIHLTLDSTPMAALPADIARAIRAATYQPNAGTSPITRASGKRKTVLARYVHNDRLIDALGLQAFAALTASPGARAYYDRQRARGAGHRAALRQLANRLVGILYGCLKTGTHYDENTAWAHHRKDLELAA